jgi:hypothetical protein
LSFWNSCVAQPGGWYGVTPSGGPARRLRGAILCDFDCGLGCHEQEGPPLLATGEAFASSVPISQSWRLAGLFSFRTLQCVPGGSTPGHLGALRADFGTAEVTVTRWGVCGRRYRRKFQPQSAQIKRRYS